MNELIIGGIYRHFKGNLYKVVALAVHSETEEKMVVYHSLESDELWVRPYDMFTQDVERDGRTVKRFTFVE